MPYSRPHHRKYYDPKTSDDFNEATTAVDLSFQLARVIDGYLNNMGTTYSNIATVIGALEMVKAEIGTRIANPYMKRLKLRNGDVFSISVTEAEPALHD